MLGIRFKGAFALFKIQVNHLLTFATNRFVSGAFTEAQSLTAEQQKEKLPRKKPQVGADINDHTAISIMSNA